MFVRHAFRADSDLVTRVGGNACQPAAVSNRVKLASARIISVASCRCLGTMLGLCRRSTCARFEGTEQRLPREADLTMKFAATKTVERLDLQAAACVSGSLSVVMSADLLPMADIGRQGWHGRKVPEPDSHTAAKARPIRSPRRRRASTLSGISMRISSAQAQAVACVRRSALLVRSQHPSHTRRSASEKSVSRYD